MMDEAFFYNIYSILLEIPKGYVVTYGQLADLAGRPKNARLVGKALHHAQQFGEYPCHRVANASGRLAPDFLEQRSLLEAEGVTFKKNGHVDLKKHQWKP